MNGDNYYYKAGCPAMMNYSLWTSYVPHQTLIDAIKKVNGFDSPKYDENDFRKFMQDNAVKMMIRENQYFYDYYRCKFPKDQLKPIRIMLPFQLDEQ